MTCYRLSFRMHGASAMTAVALVVGHDSWGAAATPSRFRSMRKRPREPRSRHRCLFPHHRSGAHQLSQSHAHLTSPMQLNGSKNPLGHLRAKVAVVIHARHEWFNFSSASSFTYTRCASIAP